ncbi:hypothetical protein GCM10009839_79150 [Catenulispora yoronensis]|uniref:Uncharacterized protein n=1 Tax=Catenulispora yoronensis TaxID=450799 RepID=A0ABP5GUI0_9ACTN
MGSLAVRVMGAFVDDDDPGVPSGPVDIGTAGVHHARNEIGSWQTLILMFISVIVVGAVVLLYVVRQRGRLVERRRLRRMAEAAKSSGQGMSESLSESPGAEVAATAATAAAAAAPTIAAPTPTVAISVSPPPPTAPTPPRPTTSTPGRPAPNA